jgi:nucleoside diphosphate kinase
VRSITRFYRSADPEADSETDQAEIFRLEDVPIEKLQVGHFVMKLFTSGAALLTIWHGKNALEKLLAQKGKTHPVDAASTAIRGRFWCDNAVCNLLHSSDDVPEMERELEALHLTDLLASEPVTMGQLAQPNVLDPHYISHSSIVVLCDVVNRMLVTTGDIKQLEYELPQSGDSKETVQQLGQILIEAAAKLSGHPISTFISAYLAGDLQTVTHHLTQMPVTSWEHFVIQCGTISRDKWQSFSTGS